MAYIAVEEEKQPSVKMRRLKCPSWQPGLPWLGETSWLGLSCLCCCLTVPLSGCALGVVTGEDWDELDHSTTPPLQPLLSFSVRGWHGWPPGQAACSLVQLLGSTLLTLQRNINLTNNTNTNTRPDLHTDHPPLGHPRYNFPLLSLGCVSC